MEDSKIELQTDNFTSKTNDAKQCEAEKLDMDLDEQKEQDVDASESKEHEQESALEEEQREVPGPTLDDKMEISTVAPVADTINELESFALQAEVKHNVLFSKVQKVGQLVVFFRNLYLFTVCCFF